MFFMKKTETSILLTKQDVEDCGLKLLPPTNEIYEKQEYHYSISWVRGDLKPIIQSKSGRNIIGDGWNKLSKIPYENQKTLEHFVIGFHQVNGVYVTKYHQVGDEVKVLVKETNRTIKLEDVSEEDLKTEDDFHLRKCLYKEGFVRNDVYPSSGKRGTKLGLPYSVTTDKNFVLNETYTEEEMTQWRELSIKEELRQEEKEKIERTKKRFEEVGVFDVEVRVKN
tara:strand:+ start:62 stop:733 length:672 start_codon:yes stop_codon:yes gene_type:complete